MAVQKTSAKAPAGKASSKAPAKPETKGKATTAKSTPVDRKAEAKAETKAETKAPAKGKETKATAKNEKAPAKSKKSTGDFEPKTYTKQDVIAEMASTHGYTKAEAEKHLDNTISSIETIAGRLQHGIAKNGKHKSDKLIFMGFMGLEIAERQAKKGWDNFNQVAIDIPAKLAIKLTVGSSLKKLAETK